MSIETTIARMGFRDYFVLIVFVFKGLDLCAANLWAPLALMALWRALRRYGVWFFKGLLPGCQRQRVGHLVVRPWPPRWRLAPTFFVPAMEGLLGVCLEALGHLPCRLLCKGRPPCFARWNNVSVLWALGPPLRITGQRKEKKCIDGRKGILNFLALFTALAPRPWRKYLANDGP